MLTEPHVVCRRTGTSRCWIRFALLVGLAWLPGCGYPEVTPETYEIAKALHTLVNQRDAAGLEKARAYVDEAHSAGRITACEHGYPSGSLASPESGDWDSAEQGIRRLLTDQTRR